MSVTWRCEWTPTDECWETSCGSSFVIEAGTPKQNEYNYCPRCGGVLYERPPLCLMCREEPAPNSNGMCNECWDRDEEGASDE